MLTVPSKSSPREAMLKAKLEPMPSQAEEGEELSASRGQLRCSRMCLLSQSFNEEVMYQSAQLCLNLGNVIVMWSKRIEFRVMGVYFPNLVSCSLHSRMPSQAELRKGLAPSRGLKSTHCNTCNSRFVRSASCYSAEKLFAKPLS